MLNKLVLNIFEKPRALFVCVSLLFQKKRSCYTDNQFHMPQKEDNKVHKLQNDRDKKKILLVASHATDLLFAYIWMTLF